MTQAEQGTAQEVPLVTLVVTPRERWGLAETSLLSIRDMTSTPFDLIYVDGGMPKRVRTRIEQICRDARYRLLPSNRFLTPNEARNRGAREARTKYVVFIDNDVFVSENWLDALIREAEASGAEVVAPITCQGTPHHRQIHQAGGTFATSAEAFFALPMGERKIDEQMFLQRTDLADPAVPLSAFDTQLCEFHCVLIRRDTLEKMGWLDENMLATKEHLDFCMSLSEAGGRVRIEPRSVVTYVFPNRLNPMVVADYPYFMLRWSPRWQMDSLVHFGEKWGLGDDPYIEERRAKLQWRHVEGIVRPSLNKVPVVKDNELLNRAGRKIMRSSLTVVSDLMARRHAMQRRSREP
jgi:cellulose synthase/poly-beta-1,6-N-acetylglucosamine synthase-like glycosyltransferase